MKSPVEKFPAKLKGEEPHHPRGTLYPRRSHALPRGYRPNESSVEDLAIRRVGGNRQSDPQIRRLREIFENPKQAKLMAYALGYYEAKPKTLRGLANKAGVTQKEAVLLLASGKQILKDLQEK